MKLIKGLLNFIGMLVAFALSIPLILMLVVGPVLYAADVALQPEILREFVLYLAAENVVPGSQQEALLEQLQDSEVTGEIVELYLEDFFDRMEGGEGSLNQQAVEQVAGSNMDEVLAMLQGEGGLDLGALSGGDLESAAKDMVSQYAGSILEGLPDLGSMDVEGLLQAVGDFSGEMMGYMKEFWLSDGGMMEQLFRKGLADLNLQEIFTRVAPLLQNYLGLKLLAVCVVILSLLILFFRMGGGYRGLFWLGSDYLIGGGISAGIALVGKMLLGKAEMDAVALLDACGRVLNALLTASTAVFALGVVFAVWATVGNGILESRRKKAAQRRW